MPGACVAITGLDPTPVQLVADGGHVGGMWRAFGKVVAKPNKEERGSVPTFQCWTLRENMLSLSWVRKQRALLLFMSSQIVLLL